MGLFLFVFFFAFDSALLNSFILTHKDFFHLIPSPILLRRGVMKQLGEHLVSSQGQHTTPLIQENKYRNKNKHIKESVCHTGAVSVFDSLHSLLLLSDDF